MGYVFERARSAFTPATLLKRQQCTRFDMRLLKSDDGGLGADVEVDCNTGGGGRITASLHAPRCK